MKRIIVTAMAAMLLITGCLVSSCTSKKETGGQGSLSPEQAKHAEAMKKNAEEARKTVVARVNGTAITMSDLIPLMNELGPKYLGPGQKPTPQLSEKVRDEALQFLIFRQLAVQEAVKEGITPKPEEIDDTFKKVRARFGTDEAYKYFLEAQGLTEADLKKLLEKQLQFQMIENKELHEKLGSLTFSEKEMKDFYDHNKAHFVAPERLAAVDIYFTSGKDDAQTRKEAEAALAELRKNGNDFSKLTGHTEIRQIMVTEAQSPNMYAALSKLKAGGISGIVAERNGLHIGKLIKKEAAGQMTFAEAKPLIQRQLILQAAEKVREAWDRELRKNAKIEIVATKAMDKLIMPAN
jgi:parvulin-like peptidyl-prolyl isomerase